MKFTCEKNSLLKEISIAHEIISTRNILSILSNIYLETSENELIIKATDMKVTFETTISVDTMVPGSTTVYCEKFLSILRSLPEGDVEFELIDNKLIIKPLFKKINFQLKSIAPEAFPKISGINENKYFSIPQLDFIEMINNTIFSVSDDETRYFMNGVYMEKDDESLSMVATDGRRLSMIKKDIKIEADDFEPIIIPPKILTLVKKLSSGEGEISIAVADKIIYFKFDNQKLTSNLIEGQFPNYRRVIPEHQDHKIVVRRDELSDAIKRVSLLVENKSRRIFLLLDKGILQLKSEESDIGVAQEEITSSYDDEKYTIALNYLYLLDPLRVIGSDEVLIKFTDPGKAISIFSLPEKEVFHIIMPMQLD